MSLELDFIFHPRSIAVVGASASPGNRSRGTFVQPLLDHHFPGQIYPVNLRAEETLGLKGYASILDIPGPLDYVISGIPAPNVLELIDQCGQKGVRVIHFFTARFTETGRAEGAKLEQEVKRRAEELGIRLIGPNCMGVYHPAQGMAFGPSPREPGSVGFLSQSGGNASGLINGTSARGLQFSKVVSYGNALDINECDLLEYFASDPETSVIGAYIEGVRDGRRFPQVVREAVARKPVVLLKGGRTEAGSRAVASHTASLAGERQIWTALAQQTGAVLVGSLEELGDMLIAFRFCPPGKGYRVGVAGGGGGSSVEAADACEEVGLIVEPIPQSVREELQKRSTFWDWISNPADGSILGRDDVTVDDIFELMARAPEYDLLIANMGEPWSMYGRAGRGGGGGPGPSRASPSRSIEIGREAGKPAAFVLADTVAHSQNRNKRLVKGRDTLVEAELPIYPTVQRAARALSRLATFYRSREASLGD